MQVCRFFTKIEDLLLAGSVGCQAYFTATSTSFLAVLMLQIP